MPDLYHEHILPSVWVWLLAPLTAAFVAVMFIPVNVPIALAAGLIVLILVVVFLWRMSPRINVTGEYFIVDRARLPRTVIAAVLPLTGDELEEALSFRLDARAYLRVRGWAKGAVRIDLNDPDDPTPYWIISTRSPDELAKCLRQA